MHGNLALSVGTLYAFLLVLARVGGALIFVPIPGFRGAPEMVRAVLALGFAMALFGRWPAVDAAQVGPATLAGWLLSEAALGLAIGVSVAITLEALMLAAQVLGLQAGYAYASTIDPNTEADSGILLVFAQLMSGMLFFAMGLDREILRLFAQSLDRIPAGVYIFSRASAEPLIRLGAILFSVGVRLALPVVALLVMLDVALALLGRLNAQLQLLSLAFPVKMLTALVVLSWASIVFPRVVREISGQAMIAAHRMLGL
uniref:Type III secretion system inner membrane R protein n=1 Tax=Solibacter usitatus (strain Ellin6076) TaxID=234267 RepID=Q01PP9_SOLUE